MTISGAGIRLVIGLRRNNNNLSSLKGDRNGLKSYFVRFDRLHSHQVSMIFQEDILRPSFLRNWKTRTLKRKKLPNKSQRLLEDLRHFISNIFTYRALTCRL
ncbi:MAG: hypothetical protein CMD87_03030 [Gammaproteobacteria bacterium]|nr:hypothetical protein [Gammaproteobacteria bacterium]